MVFILLRSVLEGNANCCWLEVAFDFVSVPLLKFFPVEEPTVVSLWVCLPSLSALENSLTDLCFWKVGCAGVSTIEFLVAFTASLKVPNYWGGAYLSYGTDAPEFANTNARFSGSTLFDVAYWFNYSSAGLYSSNVPRYAFVVAAVGYFKGLILREAGYGLWADFF